MAVRTRKGRRGPQAICDRSGKKFPYSEMVLEPGTNLFVHFTESDRLYNAVEHPQNKPIIIHGDEGILPNATGQDDDNTDPWS